MGIPIKSGYNQAAAKHSRYTAPLGANNKSSLSPALLGLQDEATAKAIKTVESAAMEREDNYRKLWMAERSLVLVVTPPTTPPLAAVPENKIMSSSKKTSFSDPEIVLKRKNVDIETSIAYLSSSHRIYLADRYARKEYNWKLYSEVVDGIREYVLRWREVNDNSGVGQAILKDIRGVVWSCAADSESSSARSAPTTTQLDIAVGSSPRALLGTGGRAVLSLVFPSEQECKQYGAALNNLIKSNP